MSPARGSGTAGDTTAALLDDDSSRRATAPGGGSPASHGEGSTAARVMAVLEVLSGIDRAQHPDGLGVSEVALRLGRDKSVASRLLASMHEAGMVSRSTSGRYQLSWRLYALAERASEGWLTRAAAPVLQQLVHTVQERAYLSVLEGGQVLTVATEGSRQLLEASGWLGRAVPVHTSSAGIALLVGLPDARIRAVALDGGIRDEAQILALQESVALARARGHAFVSRRFTPDLAGIGVPVRDVQGRVVAAINISGPAERIDPRVEVLARQLLSSARSLERMVHPTHS